MLRIKKLKQFILIVLISAISLNCFCKSDDFNDLSIIVTSCDKYAQLWPIFFGQLFKNWPSLQTTDQDIPILLIGNHKKYHDPRITMVNIENEQSWSDNMRFALSKVKTKHVLILLDDYIIDKEIDLVQLTSRYKAYKNSDAGFFQIYGLNPKAQSTQSFLPADNISQLTRHSEYRTSLQAGIWQTEVMHLLLRSGESAWAFERAGSLRSEGYPNPFLVSDKNLISYQNMVHGGVLTTRVFNYAKQQGYDVTIDLPKDTDLKVKIKRYYDRGFAAVYWNAFVPVKNFIKSIVT